jgi:outer membrane receptor for Fe3+-dicitrate
VQYVFDGLPVTDNRSIAFAPGLDADNVHSMSILTGGYPAEYGRKLGGVVEVMTAGQARAGFHGSVVLSAGSFATGGVSGFGEYGWSHSTLSVSADGARTDRYLDPPVEENFTNDGRVSNLAVHFEHDFGAADRLGMIVRRADTRFSVPNELLQEDAGQKQEHENRETLAQFSYQHVFSTTVLADVRAMTRSLSAVLNSNGLATPIRVDADRGLRETYVKGAITKHSAHHELKAGGEASFASVREQFSYEVTDPDAFEPSTPPVFDFAATRPDREQAAFVQDQMRFSNWTVNAGLRWDHYSLLVNEHAFSPRLAIAWAMPSRDFVVRASYDRVFQTPAVENLLLASSEEVDQLNTQVVRLPVRPSRGNFFEVGASKRLFAKTRVDVSHYWRDVSNFADDDVLLNTGVSFPIAFADAQITGTEIKVEMPLWRGFAGFLSYAHMRGLGTLPITGGLLLGAEAAESLSSTEQVAITQDQRHSLRTRLSYQIAPRLWTAFEASYGSGLPVEFSGEPDDVLAQYGPRIVERVDVQAGRVKPNLSLDVSAGVDLTRARSRTVRLQADLVNVLDRLNLINFAGLFSGTAIGPPRSVSVRLSLGF